MDVVAEIDGASVIDGHTGYMRSCISDWYRKRLECSFHTGDPLNEFKRVG